MVYRVSSRTAWATEKNPVSKNTIKYKKAKKKKKSAIEFTQLEY